MEVLELYIEPFVNSTLRTFKSFIGFELVAGCPHFSGRMSELDQDILGVIGLSGDVQGAVVISMKEEFAIKVTNALAGSEHADLDDDITDAVGEIVNIIAGNIKQYVQGGERIVISLPTVVKGRGHTFVWPGTASRILCISFRYEDDTFYLLADMEKTSGV